MRTIYALALTAWLAAFGTATAAPEYTADVTLVNQTAKEVQFRVYFHPMGTYHVVLRPGASITAVFQHLVIRVTAETVNDSSQRCSAMQPAPKQLPGTTLAIRAEFDPNCTIRFR